MPDHLLFDSLFYSCSSGHSDSNWSQIRELSLDPIANGAAGPKSWPGDETIMRIMFL